MVDFKNPWEDKTWGKGTGEYNKWQSGNTFGSKYYDKNIIPETSLQDILISGSEKDKKFPYVDKWEINVKDGTQTSSDNKCLQCPVNVGLDCDSGGFRNGIELKAFIKKHTDGNEYFMRRNKIFKIWEKLNNEWVFIQGIDEFRPDDTNPASRYNLPQPTQDNKYVYIYSEDRPGIEGNSPAVNQDSTEIFVLANFVEYVTLKITNDKGTGTKDDKTNFIWHSKVHIIKINDTWTFDKDGSSIGKRHISLKP